MGRNPSLFVVGCPRSGTTLLQRMLDHHPILAVTNDTHFIPHALRGLAAGDVELTPAIVERVLSYRRFPRLGVPEESARHLAARSATFANFVSALYDQVGRLHGKPLAGEKTPDYVRHLPLLTRLFPWAPVVHIIRDGRDVALSVQEWAREGKGPSKLPLWEQDPLGTAASWWRWQVETGLRDAARLSQVQYREIRYESLVADPEGSLRLLVTFLGLEYAPQMVSFHEGRAVHDSDLSAKRAWLPATPGLRDWRREMAEEGVAWFEALAGDLLSDLGYERALPRLPESLMGRAAEFRRRWQEQVRHRTAGRVGTAEEVITRPH